MQETITQTQDHSETGMSSFLESLYRTRWLMAHNRLHEAAHGQSVPLTDLWKGYLEELSTSLDVAKKPA